MHNAPIPSRQPYMLIGDRRISASKAASGPIFDPATGVEIARMPLASPEHVDDAVERAARAFAAWRSVERGLRAELLNRVADLVDHARPEIALTITLEQGKPLEESRGEVDGVSSFLRWAAGRLLTKPVPEAFQEGSLHRRKLTVPVGVVAIASPWNFPLAAAADHCIAALAQGCTVVVKPPESCPTAFALFADLLLRAGLPAGAVNVVTGEPGPIVEQLIAHPMVRKLAYTGSTEVGRLIAAQAARELKPTILELGGNAPTIVMDSADLDLAIAEIGRKKFSNAGQNCVAPNRIYVHDALYEPFCEGLKAYAEGVAVGGGMQPGVSMGPLATGRQQKRVAELVSTATAVGAEMLYASPHLPESGYFHPAVIMAGVDNHSPLFASEVFGPVASIGRFSQTDAIVDWANGVPAGLAAYVFGEPEKAQHLADALDVGMVAVNTCSIGSYELPFGGVKSSGWGYVYADEGLEGFVTQKAWTGTTPRY